ncbi:hypothetical protein FB451DRAFT_1235527 [Mycena latifolia]|nr:hypothetical protein FB451DRAFT_1235527 [Mycena latifolia]
MALCLSLPLLPTHATAGARALYPSPACLTTSTIGVRVGPYGTARTPLDLLEAFIAPVPTIVLADNDMLTRVKNRARRIRTLAAGTQRSDRIRVSPPSPSCMVTLFVGVHVCM